MKICVVTPRYTIAGVPLAQIRFARALAKKGHEVDLVIGYVESDHQVPEMGGISIYKLNKKHVRNMLLPFCRHLKKRNPDVVFSAEDHLNTIILIAAILTRSTAKISCSSRVTPYDTYSNILFSKRWFFKQLNKMVMWRADVLSCVSIDMAKQYEDVFHKPTHVCVYNIVDTRYSRKKMTEFVEHEWYKHKDYPIIVAAGKLAPWKGFKDLIYAIKELSRKRKVRLLILGDGPLRSELQALIIELCLTKVVSLLGYVENPLKFFEGADVFVLTSYVEGLPNVLVEAMMCGCTPVSTNCPTGPREVLQDGKYGYLVAMGDPVAIASGIEQALNQPISKDLLNEAIQPFEETAVINRHFEILGLKS